MVVCLNLYSFNIGDNALKLWSLVFGRGPPSSIAPQVKRWLAEVVARSQMLSDVFSSNWNFGEMSTVMRCKMGMVHEFELGFISMVDLKYKARISMVNP